ncbi:MAG: hypothetical protein R3F31_18895 [Verrucomicrobiales bacterium]
MALSSHGLDEPAMVNGDSLVLGLALRNVLSNAVDFSPQGGTLTVTLTRESSSEALDLSHGLRHGSGLSDYALTRALSASFLSSMKPLDARAPAWASAWPKKPWNCIGAAWGFAIVEGGAAVTISLPSEAA